MSPDPFEYHLYRLYHRAWPLSRDLPSRVSQVRAVVDGQRA